MAEKIEKIVKLQIPTGKATLVPSVGPTLGQVGTNTIGFTKELNARTAGRAGLIIPVVVSVYEDRSFAFTTKTLPTATSLKKVTKIEKSSGEPNKTEVTTVSSDQVKGIIELKIADLNAADVGATMRMVAGTARSMGTIVE